MKLANFVYFGNSIFYENLFSEYLENTQFCEQRDFVNICKIGVFNKIQSIHQRLNCYLQFYYFHGIIIMKILRNIKKIIIIIKK